MGRFKVKKQDTFIDMTPMSDVMVLLLTFFMLTATFVKEEPIKVITPGSISEIKIPDNNLLTIFVEHGGKVYMTMDSPDGMTKLAEAMNAGDSGFSLTPAEIKQFAQVPTFGMPISLTKAWLASGDKKNDYLNREDAGIPCDSLNNELKIWVSTAREACGENMRIAIKADKSTSYAVIKRVMDSLREIDENRYNLITSLKGSEN